MRKSWLSDGQMVAILREADATAVAAAARKPEVSELTVYARPKPSPHAAELERRASQAIP